MEPGASSRVGPRAGSQATVQGASSQASGLEAEPQENWGRGSQHPGQQGHMAGMPKTWGWRNAPHALTSHIPAANSDPQKRHRGIGSQAAA